MYYISYVSCLYGVLHQSVHLFVQYITLVTVCCTMVILFVIRAKYNLISGHVLQEVFRKACFIFSLTVSVFHFSFPFPLFPNAPVLTSCKALHHSRYSKLQDGCHITWKQPITSLLFKILKTLAAYHWLIFTCDVTAQEKSGPCDVNSSTRFA